MDAFDADALIYAAVPDHPLGRRVRALFPAGVAESSGAIAGIGSVLLLPELMIKPLRTGATAELEQLASLLGHLELRATDRATAELATALGVSHGLGALDSVHLASAVAGGADRFITNNAKDFSRTIELIDITYPADLSDPTGR